jgi:hypothetical protein
MMISQNAYKHCVDIQHCEVNINRESSDLVGGFLCEEYKGKE